MRHDGGDHVAAERLGNALRSEHTTGAEQSRLGDARFRAGSRLAEEGHGGGHGGPGQALESGGSSRGRPGASGCRDA